MKDYGIRITGVKVTADNCNNITGENIKGKVSYNPETNTITLDNTTIDGRIWFTNKVPDIIITLVGENTVDDILDAYYTKTINGTGSLKVGYINCWREKNTIIEDCTIEIATNYNWAIYSNNSRLTIKNANISAEALDVAIGYFKDIELIDCEIVKPTNAQIIDNNIEGFCAGKYVCNEDGTVAKKVVIKKKGEINNEKMVERHIGSCQRKFDN